MSVFLHVISSSIILISVGAFNELLCSIEQFLCVALCIVDKFRDLILAYLFHINFGLCCKLKQGAVLKSK